MAGSPVAALLLPFAPLLGRWEGEGSGLWDAEPRFQYLESLVLAPVPNRALLSWEQVTRVSSTGELSHSEHGYLRLLAGAAVELVVAVPAGYAEVHRGTLDGNKLELELVSLGVAPSARPLGSVQRRLRLVDQELVHEVGIGVDGREPSPHVSARLRRAG